MTELDEKDLINLFVLKNDQYTLRPEISCWAESYGPTLENHTSAHRVEIDDPTFQVQEGVIRYQVQGQGNPKNCPECFEYTGNGIDLKILKLIVKEVSVKAISIPGDSGSPLYCKDQNSKIFLVGTLYGGGTNVLSHDGKVLLRSIWTPIYSNKKLINTWERDKTTP